MTINQCLDQLRHAGDTLYLALLISCDFDQGRVVNLIKEAEKRLIKIRELENKTPG